MMDKTRMTDAPFRKIVSAIGLESLDDSAVANLVRQRRQLVIQCLEELLQKGASTAERNAAASAIGTLKELERKLTPQNS